MTIAPVRMTVEWLVPVAQTRSITAALHTVAAAIRSAPGCVRCAVCTDLDKDGTVRYVEDWQTEADLRRRLLSEDFAALDRLIEDSPRSPRVEFTLSSGYRRADFLHEVRHGAARAG